MTKAPTPTEKSKKQRDNANTPPKTSITQRLRTDFGRSVGITIVTCERAKHKTYRPLDDHLVILSTSKAFDYFRAQGDEIRFKFGPP